MPRFSVWSQQQLTKVTSVNADDAFVLATDVPEAKAIEFDDLKALLGGLRGGAARPLNTSGAFLDGTNGFVSFPVAGNFASSPDSAALDITGDIDIKAKVTMNDWTPSDPKYVVGKYETTNERSYWLAITTSGFLSLTVSTDGTSGTQVSGSSSIATGLADGATKWVRATLDVNDGAGNRVYKFYLSDDGTTWTQLGTTVTTAGTTSIHSGTSRLSIGTISTGGTASANWDGIIHRVIIQSAYDTANNTTSLAFDANFETQTADALAFTESANSATVTINTVRYFYGYPNTGFTSVATGAVSANNDFFEPFLVTEPLVVDLLAFEVTTAPASTATVHAAIYAATGNQQPTGAPLAAWGPISVATSTTGVYETQITPVTLPPGSYVLGLNSSVTFTARSFRRPDQLINTLGANPILFTTQRARTNAAFPTSSSGWNIRSAATPGRNTLSVLRWRPA